MATTIPAGSRLLAERLLAVTAIVDAVVTPPETDWSASVAWTSSGTAPSLGNATKYAKYWRIPGGMWIDAEMKIVFGASTTFGTGVWFWALPVAAASAQYDSTIGYAYALDAGTQEYGGLVKLDASGKVRVIPASNATDSVLNWGQDVSGTTDAPFTWGSTDVLHLNMRYRVA